VPEGAARLDERRSHAAEDGDRIHEPTSEKCVRETAAPCGEPHAENRREIEIVARGDGAVGQRRAGFVRENGEQALGHDRGRIRGRTTEEFGHRRDSGRASRSSTRRSRVPTSGP
jgi:hypothetical protein